jgi:23S rRNA (pseudouridine1915-N3)-methyltransferase
MHYRLLVVGRRAKDPLLDAADDYAARLGRFARLDLVRSRERGAAGERDAILDALAADELLVALDERGELWSTVDLATRVRQWRSAGSVKIAFAIGGADGLHPDVLARARWVWSLSRLTLPHRLALVLLLEQLYRAHTIVAGLPYHRA